MSQVMVYTCDVCKRKTTQNLKRDGWLCVDITHGSNNLVEVRRWDVEQADRPVYEDALHVCSVEPCLGQLAFETLFPPLATDKNSNIGDALSSGWTANGQPL